MVLRECCAADLGVDVEALRVALVCVGPALQGVGLAHRLAGEERVQTCEAALPSGGVAGGLLVFAERVGEDEQAAVAVGRLTEAFLPLLRASEPSAIVNVSSTAARVARPGSGAYSASKFALTGWSDALYAEEKPHGVHVGLVLPGFIRTEGFPAAELVARPSTRWIVSTPERVAEAIVDAGPRRRPERYVPRAYALAGVLRILAPNLLRRALTNGRGAMFTTKTGTEASEDQPGVAS